MSLTEEVFSLCMQSVVPVSSCFRSLSPHEWHLYHLFNDTFFMPVEQLHFHCEDTVIF